MNYINVVAIMLVFSIHTSLAFAGWEYQQSEITGHLWGVHFINESRGWIRGEAYDLETRDGGKTWTRMSSPIDSLSNRNRWWSLPQFISEDTGFIGTTFGKFFSTQDSGITWKEVVVVDDTLSAVSNINFINSEVGWVTLPTRDEQVNGTTQKGKNSFNTFQIQGLSIIPVMEEKHGKNKRTSPFFRI